MDRSHPLIAYCKVPSITTLGQHEDDIFPIEFQFADHIMISVSYEHEIPAECEMIVPIDQFGAGLARVPVSLVTRWLTDEDAERWSKMRDVDEELLSYAR